MDAELIKENQRAEAILTFFRKLIPEPALKVIRPIYHFFLALAAALIYRFPSRHLIVIGVTGTKGKSTVVELVGKILRQANRPVATLSSLSYSIGDKSWPNTLKMTVPGRFKLQSFLRKTVDGGAKYLILEMTSEAIKQHRHRFVKFDIAALTNLQPEHIEAHGSFEAYRRAKGKLFHTAKEVHILNFDDAGFRFFNSFSAKKKFFYGLENKTELGAEAIIASDVSFNKNGSRFTVDGLTFKSSLIGKFNIYNILCAIAVSRALGIDWSTIRAGVSAFEKPAGRLEFIEVGQAFDVVVDFAHTPDSLREVYETLKAISPGSRLICVFGATGGGRDKWKRPKMGEIAASYCEAIILTDEDPYDENPNEIVSAIRLGIPQAKVAATRTIIDRKKAIQEAISLARPGDTVIITGKGGEQWMALAGGKKIPWSDEGIVEETIVNLKRHG